MFKNVKFAKLIPDMILDSISDVDLKKMSDLKIKGFIVDIDNTLVASNSIRPDSKAVSWLKDAALNGFKVCFVSNAFRKRVTNVGNLLGIDYLYRASKPRRRSFRKAAGMMGLDMTETAVIGDQIFTDIYGGNRAGMYTILVTPISRKEIFLIKPRRILERFLLKHFLDPKRTVETYETGKSGRSDA